MRRRVTRSPDDSNPDKAPWERTHPKVRAVRRDAEAAGKRPARAVLERLERSRGPRGADSAPPPPVEPEPTDPGEAFWSAPTTEVPLPTVTPAAEFLSGDEGFFDPATGWDFDAITSSQLRAVGAPPRAAPSVEVSVEIDVEEPALTPEEALARAQTLLQEGEDAEALTLLLAAQAQRPGGASMATWLEFAERRVMRRACPTAALDRIPRLAHPLGTLLQAAQPHQAELLRAVDGATNAAALRRRVTSDPPTFWTTLGRLVERGWLRWSDEA